MSDETPTVVLVHGAFADASSWNGVVELLQAKGAEGHGPGESPAWDRDRLRLHRRRAGRRCRAPSSPSATRMAARCSRMRRPTPRTSSAWSTSPPSPPTRARCWAQVTAGSKDSVLDTALVPLHYPSGDGGESAVEFAIDPAKFHDAFAADLPAEQTAVLAATQRPVAEAAFSEPSGPPAWKRLPSWAAVASSDTAAGTDVIRSMAERAGATITELEGSHVIMISQPQAVTDVILEALSEVGSET